MYTEYDKAIAGFLTALLGVLAAFNVPHEWLNPAVIAAVTPFATAIVVWLVPNLQARISVAASAPPVLNQEKP